MMPSDLPDLEVTSTSILPILPDFCRSLRSSSSPRSPSVCPKIAPTTSGFSTMPSALIFAFTMYFVVFGSMFMSTLLRVLQKKLNVLSDLCYLHGCDPMHVCRFTANHD